VDECVSSYPAASHTQHTLNSTVDECVSSYPAASHTRHTLNSTVDKCVSSYPAASHTRHTLNSTVDKCVSSYPAASHTRHTLNARDKTRSRRQTRQRVTPLGMHAGTSQKHNASSGPEDSCWKHKNGHFEITHERMDREL